MEHLRISWNIDLKYHFVGSGLLRMVLIWYSSLLGRGLCKGWVGDSVETCVVYGMLEVCTR
jgi:hypothetical protein